VATTLNDHVGRVLGGRYRLIAPIGSGASAQVYLADDTTLRRRVAVKILHQGLATDETFLRRFRAEAQAAAAMNHPHILAVYDWGEEEVPYLVSEYLGGGSLRSMLDAGRRLTVSQALLVGLEAARGLEYAHRQKIVHRDIKPANLLFDEEGRLRIADFGIARALAEAGWTEQGTMVGTARYASPEQAKGDALTGKSDVYALGLVIIEAVTGEVPFSGDTPISTLMARVDQHVPVPKELGPLRRVLERAGNPDPDERPDAGEFIIGLMAAAEECARPAPLPLAGAIPKQPGTEEDAADRTEVHAAPVVAPPAPAAAAAPVVEPTRAFERVERTPAPRSPAPPVVYDYDEDDEEEDRHRRRWPWVLLGLLLVLGAIGGGLAYYLVNRTISHDVPDLRNATVEDVLLIAEKNDWETVAQSEYSPDVPDGRVVRTEPEAGASLEEGGTLTYWTSRGPQPVEVPQLAGMTVDAAKAELEAVGLVLGQETGTEASEELPDGTIIRADFADVTALPGTAIDYIRSTGPAPRELSAGFVGQPFDDVNAQLTAAGLVPSRGEDVYHDTIAAGAVVGFKNAADGADLPPGTLVPVGTQVQIIVSKGHAPVKVPNVIGLSFDQARQKLIDSGLTIAGVEGDPGKRVIGTDPPIGDEVPFGTAVRVLAQR
jgi:serine/threonine-protein kinase